MKGGKIVHHFNEHDQEYKFVVRLGGLANDIIVYDFFKQEILLFGLIKRWKKIKFNCSQRTLWDAVDTVEWTRDVYIRYGFKIWNSKISDGTEEFLRLTKSDKG
jgi:hypothetical protein